MIVIIATVLIAGIIVGIFLQYYKIPSHIKKFLSWLVRILIGRKEYDYSLPVDPAKLKVFGEPIKVFDPKRDFYIGTTKPEKNAMDDCEFLSSRYFWHFKEVSDYLVSDKAKAMALNLRTDFWTVKDKDFLSYLEAMQSKKVFLKEVLGIKDLPMNGIVTEQNIIADIGGVVISKIKLKSRIPEISVPLYKANPRNDKIKGIAIAIHGLGSVPEKVVGIEQRDYTRQFGFELAMRDYLVYAPFVMNLHNKATNISGLGMLYTGNTHWSIELQKLLSIVDNIKNDPELSTLPLAVYGLSAGGLLALMLGAIDRRVDIIVSSGALFIAPNEFDYTIENEINTSNYMLFDNVYLRVLFRCSDLARLVYPRPLIIEMGALDNPTGDMELWPEIKNIYAKYGMGQNLKLVWFKGFHETIPSLVITILDDFVQKFKRKNYSGRKVADSRNFS